MFSLQFDTCTTIYVLIESSKLAKKRLGYFLDV